jgi:uncharacterized protein (TIGR03437 family)
LKRLNRLLALGLLLGLGSQPAAAQALVSMRIGLTEEGARFLVDGQVYTHSQVFVWPEGSFHVVQFPFTVEADGTPTPFQYRDDREARYVWFGWQPTFLAGHLQDVSSSAVRVIADRRFPELLGRIRKEFPVTIRFSPNPETDYCASQLGSFIPPEQVQQQGVLFIEDRCYSRTATDWWPQGTYSVRVHPFPGWALTHTLLGNGPQWTTWAFPLYVNSRMTITPVFEPAKRVRFSTYPLGLSVLVDRSPVTPAMQIFNPREPQNSGGECLEHQTLPIGAPLNIPRLCVGDFDFKPGSVHTIGAEPIQQDNRANYWVFDRFNTGAGNNSTYVADNNTAVMDHIQAIFVRGVQSQIIPNVNGLKIEVDGRTDWPVRNYAFIWGEGHRHRISAPVTQRDSQGRMWRFVRWSDGGPREREITVPVGSTGFTLTAFFELLGQITVTTDPPGLSVEVNGAECVSPCTFDEPAGASLLLRAPEKIQMGEASRYEFVNWSGQPPGPSAEVVFDSEARTVTAVYRGAHRLSATSDPEGGARFTFRPASPDGFYPEGVSVQVIVEGNPGYKFIKWGQDLNTRSAVEWVTILGPVNVLAFLEKVPYISPAGIRNAAGGDADAVAPGSIIAIYGEGLSESTKVGPTNPLAQAINNTWVTVNDRMLPLIFVSPTQINAQLLSSLAEGEYTLKVHNWGKPDITATFKVRRNAPGIFHTLNADNQPVIAALHQDGTPVTPQSPARRGETITFYGTGLGSYNLPVIDGFVLPANPVYTLADPVKILAGPPQPARTDGAAAAENVPPPVERQPQFVGGAAGLVGTNLIRFTVDPGLPPGDVLELSVVVNGAQSNRVRLPVQ